MPYYATSQEWLRQSSLLLEARPSTTRITTKYSIAKPKPRKSKDPQDGDDATTKTTKTTATEVSTKPPRGALTLKTYDPVSGATLKYRTTKAAEVSRLIQVCLGQLGTKMAGLPSDPADDEVMADAGAGIERTGTPAAGVNKEVAAQQSQPQQQQPQQSGGGGGKGKKKRGKK